MEGMPRAPSRPLAENPVAFRIFPPRPARCSPPAYTLYRGANVAFSTSRRPFQINSYRADSDAAMMASLASSIDDENQFLPNNSAEPAAALAPSNELRELCHLQLNMLIGQLESRAHAIKAEMAVRCAVYRRSPASLPSGQMQLQLVAASDAREAEAVSQREDLILGLPDANEEYQEAWLVDQNLIVLPDSGGLVLPLAHNSFLVGLLVVECCEPDGAGRGPLLQPPACAVFTPADMALIKQMGTALALACALDLRAALERAGHAVRRRKVQGLVRQARKPLSTLRTLGAMLAPRLQAGEPERDMTDSIVAQGQRLGDIVSALQAYLAPPMPAVRIGTAQQQAPLPPPRVPRFASVSSSSGSDSDDSIGGGPPVMNMLQPALPSSSIGGDYWGPAPQSQPPLSSGNPSSASSSSASRRNVEIMNDASSALLPAIALAPTLLPLVASARNFASVSGVTFLTASSGINSVSSSIDDADILLPSAEAAAVPVEPIVLKRMLSQLLDGTMACAARGDCIELALEEESWEGQSGVVLATRLAQAVGPGRQGAAVAMDSDGHIFLSEFGALSRLARQTGGWFDVKVERNVGAEGASTLMAALWLPTAAAPTDADDS